MLTRCLSWLVSISIVFFTTGCLERKDKEYLDPEQTFLDYQVTAEEGNDNLTILLQFRNREDGDGLLLLPPASVKLDGEILNADSTSKGRYFYETYRPIESFIGKHTIVFTDVNRKEFKEEFDFQRFILVSPIPDTISRDSLDLEFSGIQSRDYVSVIVTDTAFRNDDTEKMFSGTNNIRLKTSDFENLSSGPVQLEFFRESSEMINQGLILIKYSLKREVFLK